MNLKSEVAGIVTEIVTHLETADDVADIVRETLKKIKETGVTKKVAEILDSALDELGIAFDPLTKRWSKHKDEWFKRQVVLVKEATNSQQLSETSAVEILKLSRDTDKLMVKSIEASFWENKAKRLEQKLEARKKGDLLSDLLKKRRS
jgi:hypothetical protein